MSRENLALLMLVLAIASLCIAFLSLGIQLGTR